MQLKSKREAIESISERKRIVNGKEYTLYDTYIGMNILTKKPERLYSSSYEKLLQMIDEFYLARGVAGDFATILTPEQVIDARTAMKMLADAKLNVSLADCARHEIEHYGKLMCYDKKAGEAYDAFLESKKLNSQLEIKKTESTTGKFIFSIGRDRVLSTVTIQDISQYIKTHFGDSAPRTYNSQVSYIKTFLSWCANPEQKIIPENPALPMKMKPVAWKRPEYLKPSYVKKLFDILWEERTKHPEYLALAVTQFFIGVRREEAIRMAQNPDTATILIEDETFRVDGGKGHTKGIAPRAAHLTENAIAWIKSFDYASAIQRVTDSTTVSYYELARSREIPMFKNCARHTFITMHVAKYHTPEVTQAMVGTSGNMRAAHYDGLAPQREGEEYFAIFPPTVSRRDS